MSRCAFSDLFKLICSSIIPFWFSSCKLGGSCSAGILDRWGRSGVGVRGTAWVVVVVDRAEVVLRQWLKGG